MVPMIKDGTVQNSAIWMSTCAAHVAAEIVGAQRMGRARPDLEVVVVERQRIVWRDEARRHRAGQEEQRDHDAQCQRHGDFEPPAPGRGLVGQIGEGRGGAAHVLRLMC
jgi:hypothetical protein